MDDGEFSLHELIPNSRENMSFKKGTFLLRIIDNPNAEVRFPISIWRVDNHKLLQKYEYCEALPNDVAVYRKTNRYNGWLCSHSWEFVVLSEYDTGGPTDNRIYVKFPEQDELARTLAEKEEERKMHNPTMKELTYGGLPASFDFEAELGTAVASILSGAQG